MNLSELIEQKKLLDCKVQKYLNEVYLNKIVYWKTNRHCKKQQELAGKKCKINSVILSDFNNILITVAYYCEKDKTFYNRYTNFYLLYRSIDEFTLDFENKEELHVLNEDKLL